MSGLSHWMNNLQWRLMMKNVPKKERPSVEEQLALMKLAGWQLEYQWCKGMDRWCVFTPDHAFLLADPDEQQAISRAFGYFIQGLR